MKQLSRAHGPLGGDPLFMQSLRARRVAQIDRLIDDLQHGNIRFAADVPGPLPSPGIAPGVRDRRRLDAFGQFEAFVLQSFVQSMLPQKAAMVYGKGTAGEVWKSMLAEKLGAQLAQSGQIGIARRLASGPDPSAVRASDGSNAMRPPVSLASTLPYIAQRVVGTGQPAAAPAVEAPDKA
ncbi:MAG: rod-binding protein, partial [Candidatus Binatia bacterium]